MNKGISVLSFISIMGIGFVIYGLFQVNLSTTRSDAHDNRRINDLTTIQEALEQYHIDNGEYPKSCNSDGVFSGHGNAWGDCNTNYIEGISKYLSRLPIDPSGDDIDGYIYKVDNSRQEYKLIAYNTAQYPTNPGSPYARCPAYCSKKYFPQCYTDQSKQSQSIYTQGGSCW